MKKLVVASIMVFFFISCNQTKQSENLTIISKTEQKGFNESNQEQSEAYNLFKNTCYACHSVISKSHDEIIAPPMVAVKRRYLMTYPEKDDFVKAMVDFTSEPTQQKAMMFGAVQQFNVMPKQIFKEEDLKKIATYIYDNDIEKPEWFDAHFQEQHVGKMGGGKRRMQRKN